MDSTGQAQPVDAPSDLAKGWQYVNVPAQWTVDGALEFPAVGAYQLQFHVGYGVTVEGPRVVVEEAE